MPPTTTSHAQRAGRTVGILFLIQLLLAIPVYTEIGMMRSVIARDFLERAAADALQIKIAVLLTFVLGALALAAALIVLPIVRERSASLGQLFLALSIVGLAAQAIESMATRDMVTMSVMFHKEGAPKEVLETLASVARSSWSSSHFTNLLLGHVKAFVFYLIVYRLRFVPQLLAGAGLVATCLSISAVTATLLGVQFSYWLVVPTGVTQLVFVTWLLVRGFNVNETRSAYASGVVQ